MLAKYLLELQIKDALFKLKDAHPSSLESKRLLDYHRKTHMIYAGALRHNPPNKPFVNSIVDLHDKFVKEMLKRGIKHNTPLKKI
jgi:hypothetical protein